MAPEKSAVLSFETLAIHADARFTHLESHRDIAPPISLSTTFRHGKAHNNWPPRPSLDAGGDPHAPSTHVYSRYTSPIRDRLEAVIAALEAAVPPNNSGTVPPQAYAVVYGSGLTAVHAMFVHYQPKRIIKSRAGYFGSEAAAQTYQRGRPVSIIYLDQLLKPDGSYSYDSQPGDLVLLESPINATNDLEDLEFWVSRRVPGAFVAVDSTFAPPPLQFPLRHGVDIVMHSTTKYMGGHSDLLGGVLVVKDPKAALGLRSDRSLNGWHPGSLETTLLLRSLRTLPLRVAQQSRTATRLARWLAGAADVRPQDKKALAAVDRVFHTSVKGTRGHEIAGKYMTGGHAACFAVTFKSLHHARLIVQRLKLFANATSLGGVESLAEWRYAVDQTQPKELIRVSVGLESFEDLREDMRQGLEVVEDEVVKLEASGKSKL
ncbi:cystathionine gamma-synthase [Gonapodya prolifera JEL478]|uniref:Cystathionine gamma-synthase n=1 Tax=Gonapodya prolifera (strain JEL478) TaxID=1344416 RepID=A0A139AAP3_GONPJ|nr:cystathionine gamma-synthase [Gonapodya prolifera JEL478]|eukprot:KXS13453.1 cystathionine gamma-synthase [Gonapodya prolifera JEL478]